MPAFKDLIHPELADVLELWLAEITKIIPLDLSRGITVEYRCGAVWICVFATSQPDPQASEWVSIPVQVWGGDTGHVVGMRWIDLHADAVGLSGLLL